jgi:GNAT superfamily N-acetyltransferase
MASSLRESLSLSIPSSPRHDAMLSDSIHVLTETDRWDIEELFVSLDLDSRCSRFGYAASDAALVTHSRSALQNACSTLGIFTNDKLSGIAEIYRRDDAHYEVSFVVERPSRRRGHGWRLLRSSMHWAQKANAASLQMIFSRHNWAMRKLAAKARAKLDLSLDELNAEIRISTATHADRAHAAAISAFF